MSALQRYVMVAIFILVVALPGGGAFLYYHFTKDPLFQPLGITRERLAEVDGQTEFVSIGVHVDWGRDRTEGMTRMELRELVAYAFAPMIDEIYFKFLDADGDQIGVTFVVGPNRYGPYPPHRMVEGIVPASVALQMTQRAHAQARAKEAGE